VCISILKSIQCLAYFGIPSFVILDVYAYSEFVTNENKVIRSITSEALCFATKKYVYFSLAAHDFFSSSVTGSHHPNDAPQQTSPNYRTEERCPLPLLTSEGQAEEEGPKAPADGDGILPPAAEREE
jgi:hypothetical protein